MAVIGPYCNGPKEMDYFAGRTVFEFEMKRISIGLFWLTSAVCCSFPLHAQEQKKEKTQKPARNFMERFEPHMVQSAEEILELKQLRIAEMRRDLALLDSLAISERRRRALQEDVRYQPFSRRLSRALAAIQLEEEEGEE